MVQHALNFTKLGLPQRRLPVLITNLLVTIIVSLASSQSAFAQVPLKIGATLAISGKLAFIGEEARRGLELAVEELNSTRNPQTPIVQLLVEDNRGEAKDAVLAVQKLLSTDSVDVIFSAFTHITEAIAPIVGQSDALMIYAATVRSVAARNSRFFRDYVDAADSAEAMADSIALSGQREITYFGEIGEACTNYFTALESQLERHAVKIVVKEEFLPTESDFKPQLLKLRAKNPKGIALCAWRQTQLIAQQLTQLGMSDIRTYHWLAPFLPAGDTPEIRSILEKNGAVTTWYGWIEPSENPSASEFFNLYRSKFGSDPRPDAAYAYDIVRILVEAHQSCPRATLKTDHLCLAKFLGEIKHQGAGGMLHFDGQRASQRPVLVMKVVDGRWTDASHSVVERGESASQKNK